MSGSDQPSPVGALPETSRPRQRTPATLTALAWVLWGASLGALAAHLAGGPWRWAGLLAVDGLTVVAWTAATFLSALVHSYARRYMAGEPGVDRFFTRLTAFTVAVLVLVAADHLALFTAAWLAMGLAVADLVGHDRDWPEAQAAARLARRSFLASTALVAAGSAGLWWITGSATVTGLSGATAASPPVPLGLAAGALLAAAVVQSALVPFHTWLLSSMTAPTPASALMHAGFVNAGGILLARFAAVVVAAPAVLEVAAVLGAVSALGGSLLKSVQPDAKRQLGCSTVAQMGFMILQAGLGFLGAAVTHLVLHGFYKAYQFLSVGEAVGRTAPAPDRTGQGIPGPVGAAVVLASALAGGVLFAALTGKGTHLDAGLVLTLVVVLTTLHATRQVVGRSGIAAPLRWVAFPALFLAAIAVYAVAYLGIAGTMDGVVTAPAELTALHGAVLGAFGLAYVAAESGLHRRSDRLYVALLNAGQPAPETILTDRGRYDGR